jgi:chorismate mutase
LQLSFFTGLGLEVQAQEVLIAHNTREEIHRVTQALLPKTGPQGCIAALFFAHPSVTAAFPAEGARAVGWTTTPLLCAQDQRLPHLGLRVLLLRAPRGAHWVGLRGANTVKTPPKNAFLTLVTAMQQQNPDLATPPQAIITTVTSDLEAFSPDEALQELRWGQCFSAHGFELNVPSIPKVLRVLMLLKTQEVARHVFLGETIQLRPDLQKE